MNAPRTLSLCAALLALLMLTAAAPARATEGLGRLFFTPSQRQELDRRRQTDAQESQTTSDSFVTLNGQVSRSSGKTTTWINGVPLHDQHGGKDPARVAVPTGEEQPSVTLKIGQTLDKVRNEVRDGLEGGEVSVSRKKAQAR